MAYNDISCVANLEETGLANCSEQRGYDAKLIWSARTFSFASEVAAETESNWEDAINAKNLYPFPEFIEIEPTDEDDVEDEKSTGISVFVREGKYGSVGHIEIAQCNLAALRTFNEAKGRVFIVDINGNIFGTSSDGIEFKGFDLSKFHVSYSKGVTGTESRLVPIRYQLKTPSEMGDYGAIPELTWDPLTLEGLKNVTVAVVGVAVEGLVVLSVTGDCDGEAISGLVEGDFTILASDGTTEMLASDSYTDNGDGTYDFVFTTPVLPADTYTANLKAASAQTTGGYEPGTAASFVIS